MEIGTFGAIVERYYESSQHVVYYVIKVWHNLSKISWTLDKRYSHFDKFHKELFKKYTDIPSLPHKTLFRRYSNNFLNKRQQGINDFLRYILSNDKVIESDEIRIFFEFDQYVPRPRLIVPQLISLINTQKNPISVIIYKSMLFLCETDMKILRNSSGNISISINEEVNDTCNIGNVVLMHTYKNYVYTEQWTISFVLEISCINWNEDLELLVVGTADGIIFFYKILTDLGFTKFEQLWSMTKHSKKVVSIEIDPQTSTIYTCAKDNKLILTSLNQSTSELEIDGEIVLLKSDFLHEIIILATKADGILVFNSINMHQIRVIQTQFNVFTMSISQNSFIFIGLETGDLEVYNESSLLNTLKTKTEIKCIIYIGNRDEIFIGDEAGNINIWNRGKGVLCFIWKAHDLSINSLSVIESDEVLVSSSKNNEIKIWKLPKYTKDPNLYDQGKFEAEVISK